MSVLFYTFILYLPDSVLFSGILKLNKLLDRKTTPTFVVRVVAMDNGNPKLTSTATITINVQDINDNTPAFAPYSLTYNVKEDSAVNTPVATISATDDDLAEFGTVVYTFDVSNPDSKLQINRTTVSDHYTLSHLLNASLTQNAMRCRLLFSLFR